MSKKPTEQGVTTCMARHAVNRGDYRMTNPGLVLLAAAGLLLGSACGSKKPPSVASVSPTSTLAGKPFGKQPSGDSVLAVNGASFVDGANVRFGTQTLRTVYGSSATLTALVPANLYEAEREIPVTVQNPDGQISNTVVFSVEAASGLPPNLSRVVPNETVAGRGFQVQPNGESAMSLDGSKFFSGATVLFDDQELVTAYAGTTGLTAIVPAGLMAKVRKVAVRVRNPDGQLSNALDFTIRAQ